jgi:hypothetical protein
MEGRNGLNSFFYPELGANFPFYDRSVTDAFNVSAEFTITTQARHLAAYLYLLSQTGTPQKAWKSAPGKITGAPAKVRSGEKFTASFEAPGMPPLEEAQVVWEASGSEPVFGPKFEGAVGDASPGFLEVEAVWPDGRRVSARQDLAAAHSNATAPAAASDKTIALVNFDDLPEGRLPEGPSGKIPALTVTGSVESTSANVAWNRELTGRAIRFQNFESFVEVNLGTPDLSAGITVSFWLYGEKFCYGVGASEIAGILQGGKRVTSLRTSKWPKPVAPDLTDAKGQTAIGWEQLKDALSPLRWHFYQLCMAPDGAVQLWEDGRLLGKTKLPALQGDPLAVRFGGFKGLLDDIHVQKGVLP